MQMKRGRRAARCFGERLRCRKTREKGGSNKDASCEFRGEKTPGIRGLCETICSHSRATDSRRLDSLLEAVVYDTSDEIYDDWLMDVLSVFEVFLQVDRRIEGVSAFWDFFLILIGYTEILKIAVRKPDIFSFGHF